MNNFLLFAVVFFVLIFSSCGNNSSTSSFTNNDSDTVKTENEQDLSSDETVIDEDVQTEGGVNQPCRTDKGCDESLICTDDLVCVTDSSEPVKKDINNMVMWTGKVFFPDGISFKYEEKTKSDNDETVYANYFCDNLSYGGYDDWRLPSIIELRKLVVGCENTVSGGKCEVGKAYEDGTYCTGYKCGQENCNDVCQYRSSIEGTGGCYWSGFSCPENWQSMVWSSTFYKMGGSTTQYSWIVVFSEGSIIGKPIYIEKASIVCVRNIAEEEINPPDEDNEVNDSDNNTDFSDNDSE